MKSIAIFNNKGGVGKTTLSYHLAHALALEGKKTLILDLDPQCNFSIFSLDEKNIGKVWSEEEPFIDGFQSQVQRLTPINFKKISEKTRSMHFLLKPVEEGIDDLEHLPAPMQLAPQVYMVPGRLSLHTYEDKISSRWSDVFVGDPLALRTVSNIRRIAVKYGQNLNFDVVLLDTSPSLGILNRVILSMADGFIVPCNPDLFSLYGVRNIGRSLEAWQNNFRVLDQVLPPSKKMDFPKKPVQFLGYTIYKAAKYSGRNEWDLATGHYNYAKQIPETIKTHIPKIIRADISEKTLLSPIGGTAVMHSHQTMATMAQKYKKPIWEVPSTTVSAGDKSTISGNRARYEATQASYRIFSKDLIERMESL